MDEGEGDGQLELMPALARARDRAAAATERTAAKERAAVPFEPAPELPVARVLVDVPLAHLDRPFDYLVPAKLHEQVVPGSRVKVRFAGQDVDGYVVERVAESDHTGRLAPLRRAVSAEPVLTPDVATLVGAVAERYAGTRSDVLRLAVPPRHATTEKHASPAAPAELEPDAKGATAWWERYADGAAFVEGLREGRSPRAVWTALPGEEWETGLARAAAMTHASGRGAVLCAPDHRDLTRLDRALTAALGEGRHVVLTADAGPAERYRAFLAVSRGQVRIVAGTRAAAFAPVRDLGLVAVWDDGDDLYAEPRAPYPHTREVLLLRAHETGCAALVGGTARSVESAALVTSGWATELRASREEVRRQAPVVHVAGGTDRELERDPAARSARLPSMAYAAIRTALESGPVLVQTPRAGYAEALVCDRCREPARCRRCAGPLHLPSPHGSPVCRWCGVAEPEWSCAGCGGRGLRAPVLGDRRTAEELGRAFPRVPVRRSSGERVLDEVQPKPAIVVATPGAEPRAAGGYAAVVLLDTWLMLARPDLRTTEESVRRWFNAATLARPAAEGGQVVAVGDPANPALQALVRWDPAGFAEREAEERRSAHLPPASRLAVLSGAEAAVEAAVAELALPSGAELLGPVPEPQPGPPGSPGSPSDEGPRVRVVVRVPRRSGAALSRALKEVQGVRAARKLPAVRVQVDPYALG
ncbi:MAG TPA: primosomal protein N' [Marmoricola sp.]|nr:primosomal protein N' [Marmoricola sp.]